jgi:hypothetical protein
MTRGDIAERFDRHRTGRGAKLLAIVTAAGITFSLARVWLDVPRFTELKLKARKRAQDFCPICRDNAPAIDPKTLRGAARLPEEISPRVERRGTMSITEPTEGDPVAEEKEDETEVEEEDDGEDTVDE